MSQKFSDRLVKSLDAAKVNQSQLSQKLGVTKQAVSMWKYDKSVPTYTVIEKIADILGVNFTWLLSGDGQMTLTDSILNTVSENEHFYGGRISIPVVSKITSDKYDSQDIISHVSCDKSTINSTSFYLYMFEEKLATKGIKIIWKGDLLLINPDIKDFYPGDLVAIVTHSGRQWVRYIENWDRITLQLQGGIKLNSEEIAGMYRIVKVRPAEFEV